MQLAVFIILALCGVIGGVRSVLSEEAATLDPLLFGALLGWSLHQSKRWR